MIKGILVFAFIGFFESILTENDFFNGRKIVEDQQVKIRNLESTIQIQKRIIQRQEKENRKIKTIFTQIEKHSNYFTNDSMVTFVEKCIDDINIENEEISRGKKYIIIYTVDTVNC